MRIALIVPGFSAHEGDWCIPALLDLVRSLAHEHEVRVFALRYPHFRKVYEVGGAWVDAFGGAEAGGLGRFPMLASALTRIVSLGRREPFDVIHAIWADEPGLLAVTAGRLLRTPTVVSIGGGELVAFPGLGYGGQLSRINRWMCARALRCADAVTVGSKLLAEMARTHGARHPQVLPLGVDTGRFAPVPSRRTAERRDPAGTPTGNGRRPVPHGDRTSVRLLHVASLTPVKDQEMLLEGFAHVCRERTGVTLEIVGQGPMRQRLEGASRRLEIEDRVRFHGEIPHERLPELYRAADLLVLSSRHESQSLAALEAAACGTPVVGTAVGVIPELADGRNVVPVGDAAGLGSVILRLVDDDEGRRRLARNQREVVSNHYALDGCVERLVSLYHDMATIRPAIIQNSR